MIKLICEDIDNPFSNYSVTMEVREGLNIDEMREIFNTFLIACGYHPNSVLKDNEEGFDIELRLDEED